MVPLLLVCSSFHSLDERQCQTRLKINKKQKTKSPKVQVESREVLQPRTSRTSEITYTDISKKTKKKKQTPNKVMQISKSIYSSHMNLGIACWVLITYQKRAFISVHRLPKFWTQGEKLFPLCPFFFLSIC